MPRKSLGKIMQENEAKPVSHIHGIPVVSFAEQRDIAQDMVREKIEMPRKYNPDGTLAKTSYSVTAINMGAFYDNRFKTDGGRLYLVTAQTTDGYRAIQEMDSGRVPFKRVPTLVFERVDGKLKYIETVTVSDDEFLADFTHKLNEEAMRQLLPLIPVEGVAPTDDALPI